MKIWSDKAWYCQDFGHIANKKEAIGIIPVILVRSIIWENKQLRVRFSQQKGSILIEKKEERDRKSVV